jgi:acylphosphatase
MVEITCQGDSGNLDKFIADVKKGPAFSRVLNFTMEEVKDSPVYDIFEIKY